MCLRWYTTVQLKYSNEPALVHKCPLKIQHWTSTSTQQSSWNTAMNLHWYTTVHLKYSSELHFYTTVHLKYSNDPPLVHNGPFEIHQWTSTGTQGSSWNTAMNLHWYSKVHLKYSNEPPLLHYGPFKIQEWTSTGTQRSI